MLNISLQQKMLMKLSPQQVQYLKMLQLPTLALEQKIKAELEMNPLLEEGYDEEVEVTQEEPAKETPEDGAADDKAQETKEAEEDKYTIEDYMNDDNSGYKAREVQDDEEKDDFPQADTTPLYHRLLEQLHLLDLDEQEGLLGQEIIGNIDEDGYLRRELATIVQDLNLTHGLSISLETAEMVLKKIQRLDPVGIASRTLQECLIVQLEVSKADPALKLLALRIMKEMYEDFTMRHFEEISKKLSITLDELKKVIWFIQHLNPKPGEGDFTPQDAL